MKYEKKKKMTPLFAIRDSFLGRSVLLFSFRPMRIHLFPQRRLSRLEGSSNRTFNTGFKAMENNEFENGDVFPSWK